MRELIQATFAARQRTGCQSIGTRVEKGRFQVVRCTFGKRGASTIEEVSGWLDMASTVEFLNRMGGK